MDIHYFYGFVTDLGHVGVGRIRDKFWSLFWLSYLVVIKLGSDTLSKRCTFKLKTSPIWSTFLICMLEDLGSECIPLASDDSQSSLILRLSGWERTCKVSLHWLEVAFILRISTWLSNSQDNLPWDKVMLLAYKNKCWEKQVVLQILSSTSCNMFALSSNFSRGSNHQQISYI